MPDYTKSEIESAIRELVLDLVECLKPNTSSDTIEGMVQSAKLRAHRLSMAGVDWKKHKVRSKLYKGALGSLFDMFIHLQSKQFVNYQPTTILFKGHEGQSVCCGKCNSFLYITGTPICPSCGNAQIDNTITVSCANPLHNEAAGCGNKSCFKFIP